MAEGDSGRRGRSTEGDSRRRGRSVGLPIIMGVALVLLAIWMYSFQIDFDPFWTVPQKK
jgi:hypothetical protein